MPTSGTRTPVFRVLDAMDGPHRGIILRLRLDRGDAPAVRSLKGARLRAVGPDGNRQVTLHVEGFPTFGGRPSDRRLARTGRVDLHVRSEEGDPEDISPGWTVQGPRD
jgi:hypothetical protein